MQSHLRHKLAILSSATIAVLMAASTSLFAQTQSAKQGTAKTQPKLDANGQPAPVKPANAVPDPEAQRKMEELLLRWENQSKKVTSLAVHYTRVDDSKLFKARTEYVGDARLKSPNLVYLDFNEVVENKAKTEFAERIVCDDKNVYQFLGPTKQVFVFPLDANPNNKALDQGPLPFLFNMSVAKAKSRYSMRLFSEDQNYYKIEIVPKLPIDREEYSRALVVLDKARFLPVAIRLWSPDGNDTKSFTFADKALVENVSIATTWFDGVKMMNERKAAGWQVVVNPGPNDLRPPGAGAAAPKANPKAAAPGPVGAKPAAKSGAVRQR